ncbi:hypothetical protein ACFQ2B_06345 [Streptomyces stramineus]
MPALQPRFRERRSRRRRSAGSAPAAGERPARPPPRRPRRPPLGGEALLGGLPTTPRTRPTVSQLCPAALAPCTASRSSLLVSSAPVRVAATRRR